MFSTGFTFKPCWCLTSFLLDHSFESMCVQESSQLLVHQQRLEAAVLESEETLRRCEALSSELDVIRLQKKDKV